jgi:hypothetical protein
MKLRFLQEEAKKKKKFNYFKAEKYPILREVRLRRI